MSSLLTMINPSSFDTRNLPYSCLCLLPPSSSSWRCFCFRSLSSHVSAFCTLQCMNNQIVKNETGNPSIMSRLKHANPNSFPPRNVNIANVERQYTGVASTPCNRRRLRSLYSELSNFLNPGLFLICREKVSNVIVKKLMPTQAKR